MNPLELIDICQGHKVFVQTHNFPDPDAIASAFGLQKLMEHYGIKATICHEGSIDKLSAIKMLELCGIQMNAYDSIKDEMKAEDYIVLVDCQKENGNTADLVGNEIAAIDHHPTVVPIEYRYSDLLICGSCSSIVAYYYKLMGVAPLPRVATALLYGLRMDTLQFTRGVTKFDIDTFGYLFEYIDQKLLNELESNNMEFSDLEAYDMAINSIQVFGTVGFSYIDLNCPDALVATLSDFILSLIEVEVAVVYAIRNDGYKFSVRSERDDVDAGKLVRKSLGPVGNGGGHSTMAGGFVRREKLEEYGPDVYNTVKELFMKVLEEDYKEALK